jgi:hypothetical protein
MSDDSDTEPQFINHQLNSSAEEIIHELSEEEDCDRSVEVSDQSEDHNGKTTVLVDRSGGNFETQDNLEIARKLFHGPNAISMQDLSSEENMKKLYNTFFR